MSQLLHLGLWREDRRDRSRTSDAFDLHRLNRHTDLQMHVHRTLLRRAATFSLKLRQ